MKIWTLIDESPSGVQIPGHLKVFQHTPKIRYVVDTMAEVTWEQWTGNVGQADLAAHWQMLLKNEDVIQRRRTIVDLTRATIDLRGQDLQSLIDDIVVPLLSGKTWITAIIVNSAFQHGFSRQYGAFADMYSVDQIFRSEADALAWINTQKHEAS